MGAKNFRNKSQGSTERQNRERLIKIRDKISYALVVIFLLIGIVFLSGAKNTADSIASVVLITLCIIWFIAILGGWASRFYLWFWAIAIVLVGFRVNNVIWHIFTPYSPKIVSIFPPRNSEWTPLNSTRLTSSKFKNGDVLRIWSRSDFDIQLFISNKRAYWDSLRDIKNFKYYVRTDPTVLKFRNREKNRSFLSTETIKTPKNSYLMSANGHSFSANLFGLNEAYNFTFIQDVDSVKIKTHPDSLLAINTYCVGFMADIWIPRISGVLLLIGSCILSLKFARRALKEPTNKSLIGQKFKNAEFVAEEGPMQNDKDFDKLTASDGTIVRVPKRFDIEMLKAGLIKYAGSLDTPAGRLYKNSISTRFKQGQQIKNIRKLALSVGVATEYLYKIEEFSKAEMRLENIDREREIFKADQDLELAKIKAEKKMLDVENEAKVKRIYKEFEEKPKLPPKPEKSPFEKDLDTERRRLQLQITGIEGIFEKHNFLRKKYSELTPILKKEGWSDDDIKKYFDDLDRDFREKGLL